jgi:endonuclease G
LAPSAYNLIMGKPSKTAAGNDDDFLVREPYFTLSYNNSKGTPNWVSWHLSTDHLGTAERRKRFIVDDLLPENFSRIKHNDYTNSGFQRGHMCPHSDRAANKDMSFATFVMSNIVPQSSACNEGSWESLEAYGVAGPIGKGGKGEHPTTGKAVEAETIADGKVTVPAKVFKVILVVDPEEGTNPRTWVDDDSRLIAVIMPNDMTVEFDKWPQYRVSVDEVEKATDYTFFSAVNAKLKEKKKVVDAVKIPKLDKKHGHPG